MLRGKTNECAESPFYWAEFIKVHYRAVEHKLLSSHGRVAARGHGALQKKEKKVIDLILDGNYVYKVRGKLMSSRSPLRIFVRVPNCPGFETSVSREFTANKYLAEPFDFLWPTLFICVQNFTSFIMVETAQSVVVTAQRGQNNCAQLRGNIDRYTNWQKFYRLKNKTICLMLIVNFFCFLKKQ